MHLHYVVGNGAESGHRSEGLSLEVHVQSGYNDAHIVVGKFVADIHKVVAEELRFVYANDVNVVTALVCLTRSGQDAQDVSSTRYRRRRNGVAVMRHNVLLRITVVYLRLEYNNPLAGKSCSLDAAYKFLCLSREHGAAHHFYSSLAMELAC